MSFHADRNVATDLASMRFRFVLWLITLPIVAPIVAMLVILECRDTIEAVIRLIRHQY